MGNVIAAGRSCVLGTDQSTYQPPNNVDRYVGCRVFVVNKFSGGDGALYLDRTGPTKNAAMRGRAWRGGYHFLGGETSGEAQADFFVRATGGYLDFELPPTIDFETYGNRGQFRPSAAILRGCITELHRLIPRRWTGPTGKPVACNIYTGATMAGLMFAGLEDYDLWLAAYLNGRYPNPWPGVTNGCTPNVAALGSPDRYIPWPWRTWGAWQYAGGDGGAPGVGNESNGCDQDAMTDEMFNRMTGSVVVQPPRDWFDTVTEDEFNKIMDAKLKPINDRLGNVEGQLALAIDLIGRSASRLYPVKLAGDGDWVIFVGENPDNGKSALVRAKLPDGATFAALIDAGVMFAESPTWAEEPTSHREIGGGQHPDWVDAIKRLPVVPWPDPVPA